MKPSEKPAYSPDHESVDKRIDEGREEMKNLKDKVAPTTGYLDTQLFPGKPKIAPYEEPYSFPDDQPGTKTTEESVQEEVD
jgi:hypothetical protein